MFHPWVFTPVSVSSNPAYGNVWDSPVAFLTISFSIGHKTLTLALGQRYHFGFGMAELILQMV